MTDQRKDLPPSNSPQFLERVREAMSTYLGNRGDKLDRGVTLRDLYDSGIVSLSGSSLTGSGKASIAGIGTSVAPKTEVDLTPPPTPTGFSVSAAITTIFLSCDAQVYTQGRGHARTVVYGATYTTGPVPVFANAVAITTFSGTVFSHSSNPATKWRLWIKWLSLDGVLSVVPAGGTNGLEAVTGQDVTLLLEALSGQIRESQLYTDLGARIKLIDAPISVVGSVNYRVNTENLARLVLADNVRDNQAILVQDYYTKSSADGAISQSGTYLRAYSDLGVKTFSQAKAPTNRGINTAVTPNVTVDLVVGDIWVNTALAGLPLAPANQPYRWNGAVWVVASDASIAKVDSRVTNVETAQIGYCTIGGIATDYTNKSTCNAAGGIWNVGIPMATAVKQVAITTTKGGTVSLEQRFTAQETINGEINLQYTVKLDQNGYVAGFGFANTPNFSTPGTPSSAFAIRADRFFIASPNANVGPGDSLFVAPTEPFVVQTTPTFAAGLPVPVGVYINAAFIKNADITQAKISSVKADCITTGVLQAVVSQTGAMYSGVNAYTLTTDPPTGVVTASYTGQTPGTQGFGTGYYLGNLLGTPQLFVGSPTKHLLWNGSSLIVRGTIYADAGEFKGELKGATGTFAGSLSAATGTFAGDISAATGTFSGSLSAVNGTFSGTLTAANSVNTLNIANNAVTATAAASGAYSAYVNLFSETSTTFQMIGTWVQGNGRGSQIVRMFLNGSQVASESPIAGTIGVLTALVTITGANNFAILADNNVGDMRCNILVLGVKK